MAGLTAPLHLIVADGFADDCDDLMHQCLQETPVTFESFSKIFRRMQMSCVFHDRSSGAELAELSEEIINIAKHYMLANTSNFEETVVGLFLVYAMVTMQPFPNFASLRLVDEDVPLIVRIEQLARRDKRLDVLYVLGRLLVEHTKYHAAYRERGMELTYRKYLEGCTMEFADLRPKGVFLRQNEELEIIKELNALQLRYDTMKAGLKDNDLNYIDPKLPSELDSTLRNVIAGIVPDKTKVDEVVPESARSIKDRAMRTKVDGIKYLIGVNERSPTITNAPQISDMKTSKTPKRIPDVKRSKKTSRRKLTKSRKRKREASSDSSVSDVSIASYKSDATDINLDTFDIANPEPSGAEAIEIDSRNLKFEELPCTITSEDNGQLYEIEIVDEFLSDKSKNNNNSKTNKSEKNNTLNPRRGRSRNLKKPILRSRLKRTGMDSLANFKT